MSNSESPLDDRFDFLKEELKNIDATSQDWSHVEKLVFAARNYVVPGDQLRPRTLDAAREINDDKRRKWRVVRLIAAMFVCVGILIPTLECFSTWRDERLVTDASDLERRAEQIDRSSGPRNQWGLYEAFSELRTEQATRLGQMVR